MKDMLAQFIDDYNHRRISLGDLQRRLAFDQWRQDKPCRLIDYIPERRSPEDITIAKEDYLELYKALIKLRHMVKPKTWKSLCMTAFGYSQITIAERLGITQSAVSKQISRVYILAKQLDLDVLLKAVIAWK